MIAVALLKASQPDSYLPWFGARGIGKIPMKRPVRSIRTRAVTTAMTVLSAGMEQR